MRFNIFRRLIFSKVFTHDICIRISFFFFLFPSDSFSPVYMRGKKIKIFVYWEIYWQEMEEGILVYQSWWAIDFSLS